MFPASLYNINYYGYPVYFIYVLGAGAGFQPSKAHDDPTTEEPARHYPRGPYLPERLFQGGILQKPGGGDGSIG